MSLSMSQAEREEFLAGVHVGVLSVGAGEGRAPITTPVWYSYQPGGTGGYSRTDRDHLTVPDQRGSPGVRHG
jgi:nitroimidazol reductase NimA-like FMN-containing flavoprotein (pyridoxamine 5'-phosphate oxidase superfamily)